MRDGPAQEGLRLTPQGAPRDRRRARPLAWTFRQATRGARRGADVARLAALQLRDEQRFFDRRIKRAQELAGVAVLAERDGAETLAGQLPEAPFGEANGTRVGGIELVPRVTRAIHNDLYLHVFAPFLGLLRRVRAYCRPMRRSLTTLPANNVTPVLLLAGSSSVRAGMSANARVGSRGSYRASPLPLCAGPLRWPRGS